MTTQPTPRTFHLHKSRVPHTSILMCGHRAKLNRLPLPTPKALHPERSGAQSKDPDTTHLAKTDRTIPLEDAPAFGFAVASEIGLGFSPDILGQQKKQGFSPRDMLSSLSLNIHNEAHA